MIISRLDQIDRRLKLLELICVNASDGSFWLSVGGPDLGQSSPKLESTS